MKKITFILSALSLMLASFTAGAENVRGDVDLDGNVSITDVTALIDYLLTGDASGISLVNADCNLDGQVNIADVAALIDYLLTGNWSNEPVTPPEEGDWMDLGLPSGTIWATRNIGASSPEDYGDYFAWGETEPKNDYRWTTYKWRKSGPGIISKYCTDSDYGTVDGKTELDPEDDAAWVNWGASWRMPSLEQLQELVEHCTWSWTTRNGVNGWIVIGSNGSSIFLPAAGESYFESIDYLGVIGEYWSRTLYLDSSLNAYELCFGSSDVNIYEYQRNRGLTVRAVRVSQN